MALGIRKTGGFIAATAKGLAYWDTQHKKFETFSDPLAGRAGIRFNDAATDSRGRFWVGTLNEANPKGPDGELYCLQSNNSCQLMDKDITVANGIGWSPNQKIMYFIDSFRYCIYAYDYPAEAGTISNRRVFVQNTPEDGIPDGLTVDTEGFVWCAYCGGWKVVRYNPDGKVDREYRLARRQPHQLRVRRRESGRALHHVSRSGVERRGQAPAPAVWRFVSSSCRVYWSRRTALCGMTDHRPRA